jgi:hypothetical protein
MTRRCEVWFGAKSAEEPRQVSLDYILKLSGKKNVAPV